MKIAPSIPVSPIHRAAETGDLAAAERLLKADPYLVSSREDYKLTPLHRAAMRGHTAVAAALHAHGAPLDAKDHGGATPLHGAAAHGWADAAAWLIDRGAKADARDQDAFTPLHLAARGGHEAVAAVLLGRGADPNARGQITGTPLHEAAAQGHRGMVELLLAKGAIANARSGGSHAPFTPWHAAQEAGCRAVADLLRQHGGQDKAASAIGVQRAAEAGYLGRLRLLLDADPGLVAGRDFLYRRTPLHWAANSGHAATVALLLAKGAAIDARDKAGQTPFDRATAMGHAEIAAMLRPA
jgi:cytohesin